MKKSTLSPFIRNLFIISIIALISLNYGFKAGMNEQDWLNWSNKCLLQTYDASPDADLKKFEIMLTSDYFLRLRKTYQHGRQTYFSFNLHRLNTVEYQGNEQAGILQLSTITDDIIMQTYDDPKGNIDSMATSLTLPVKNMPVERLDSLKIALTYFKKRGL